LAVLPVCLLVLSEIGSTSFISLVGLTAYWFCQPRDFYLFWWFLLLVMWFFQHGGSLSLLVPLAARPYHIYGSNRFFLQPSGSINHREFYIVESSFCLFGSLARFFPPCGSFGSSNILVPSRRSFRVPWVLSTRLMFIYGIYKKI